MEVKEHPDADTDHHGPDDRIAVFPLELGHVLEVHSVDAGHEGERNEAGGDDGKHLHHLLCLLPHAGEVQVLHTAEHLPEGFDRVDDLNRVIVEVANVARDNLAELEHIAGVEHSLSHPETPFITCLNNPENQLRRSLKYFNGNNLLF
jgi:hypothetical protein